MTIQIHVYDSGPAAAPSATPATASLSPANATPPTYGGGEPALHVDNAASADDAGAPAAALVAQVEAALAARAAPAAAGVAGAAGDQDAGSAPA